MPPSKSVATKPASRACWANLLTNSRLKSARIAIVIFRRDSESTRTVTTFVSRGVSLHWLLAPAVGFEPTTNRLTADRSTTELRWIICHDDKSLRWQPRPQYISLDTEMGYWYL